MRLMVVSFARGLTIKCEPAADRQKIRKAIDGTGKGLSTHLYDAMSLHDLAESTGGRVYEASKDLTHLREAFNNIAEELGRQYTLGYYPRRKDGYGERRRIKLRVNRSDVAVRARDSYIYKGSSIARTSPSTGESSDTKSPAPVLKSRPFVMSVKR